jgi:dienelactone hydrolase
MKDHIIVQGQDGKFAAYIARPETVPAPAVVVLQELFGVNADIRRNCDELEEQGYIALAPDLYWRQEPGVEANTFLCCVECLLSRSLWPCWPDLRNRKRGARTRWLHRSSLCLKF